MQVGVDLGTATFVSGSIDAGTGRSSNAVTQPDTPLSQRIPPIWTGLKSSIRYKTFVQRSMQTMLNAAQR